MGLIDLPEKIIMWPLNKIDSAIFCVKRIIQKYRYRKKTEMLRFGIFWKYQYRGARPGKKEQIAIPYCPRRKCRIELAVDNDGKLLCPECKKEYITKDDGEIPPHQAQQRMTHIFKSKMDLD